MTKIYRRGRGEIEVGERICVDMSE